MAFRCFHCGTDIEYEGKIGRGDLCPKCSSSVKCCMNCRFHERSAHNQCLEPAAEWVSDKERSNFCEYFEPAMEKRTDSTSHDAKEKWDSLFKK
jgi:hypothetical protein